MIKDNTFEPVECIKGDARHGLVVICDHARNTMPDEYEKLGLDDDTLARHIAYDIGARDLSCALARALDVPAVLSTFSRLLIDPNRGEDDPTLIMEVSDGVVIRRNSALTKQQRQQRLDTFHRPYHRALERVLDEVVRTGRAPAILSIHSFTPYWKTTPRPWHGGILWDRDPRLAAPLIAGLAADTRLNIGDNEPYTGALKGDTMYRHGTKNGFAHALLEVRQDLICNERGVAEWTQRVVSVLSPLLRDGEMFRRRRYGSRANPSL